MDLDDDGQDEMAEVAAKFASARTDVLLSGVLLILASTAFLVFIVGAAEICRRDAGEGLLVGLARSAGILDIGVFVVYAAIFGSLAASLRISELSVSADGHRFTRRRPFPLASAT